MVSPMPSHLAGPPPVPLASSHHLGPPLPAHQHSHHHSNGGPPPSNHLHQQQQQQHSSRLLAPTSSSSVKSTTTPPPAPTPTTESDETDDLMLRWEDHHKSFFELAEDLCHQEQFIDVTISCGDHNFPAHKLILSVCSPYFKNLFLRNPCKHPIVVLKDVHFKYMKLLLIFMYRGEVAVPQEDLPGLLKVSRSLQVRGLAEMAVAASPTPPSPPPATGGAVEAATVASGSPASRKRRYLSELMMLGGGGGGGGGGDSSDLESNGDFSIDTVRSRLHGQLEIQVRDSNFIINLQLASIPGRYVKCFLF